MMNQNLKVAVLAAAAGLGLVFCQPANASIVYSYVTDSSTYLGAPGSTVQVKVYLKEALSGSSTSLLASENGLAGFNALVTEVSPPPSNGAMISTEGSNSNDFPLFNTDSNSADGSSGLIAGAVPAGTTHAPQPGNGPVGTATAGEVYLGFFNFKVGGPGTSTPFVVGASDPVNGGNTTTLKNVYDLDTQTDQNGNPTNLFTGVGTTTTRFVISAPVPEPASVGVFALGGLLALRRRRA